MISQAIIEVSVFPYGTPVLRYIIWIQKICAKNEIKNLTVKLERKNIKC